MDYLLFRGRIATSRHVINLVWGDRNRTSRLSVGGGGVHVKKTLKEFNLTTLTYQIGTLLFSVMEQIGACHI